MGDIDLRFFVSQDEAEKAWQNQLRKAEQLKIKLQEVERASKQGGQTARESGAAMESAFTGAALKLGGIARAWDAIKAGVQATMEVQRQYMRDLDVVARKNNEQKLKLQIQGGFTPAQAQQQLPNIERALTATPSATPDEALALQIELASSGFNEKDVKSGRALRSTLRLKAATNQYGRDVGSGQEGLQSLSMWAMANGIKEPSAADIDRMGAKATEMFKVGKLQFPDIAELAGEASTMKLFGMNETDQLAAFSALREVKTPAEAATGLRQFLMKTGTVKGDKTREKAVRKLGLKPDQLNQADPLERMELLASKLGNLPDDKRNAILSDIYGEKAISSAALLVDPKTIAVIKQRQEALANAEAGKGDYEKNINAFETSPYAEDQKAGIEADFSKRRASLNKGPGWDRIRERSRAGLAKKMETAEGAERVRLSAEQAALETSIDFHEKMGVTPSEVGFGFNDEKLRAQAGFDPTTIPTVSDEEAEARREKAREARKGKRRAPAEDGTESSLRDAEAGVAHLEANPRFATEPAEMQVQRASEAVRGMADSPEKDAAEDRLVGIMARLEQALERNTEATKDNSRTAGSGGGGRTRLTSERLGRG